MTIRKRSGVANLLSLVLLTLACGSDTMSPDAASPDATSLDVMQADAGRDAASLDAPVLADTSVDGPNDSAAEDAEAPLWDPSATVLGAAAAALAPGEWALVPMEGVEGRDLPLLEYCEEAPWIDRTGQLSIINSGHGMAGAMFVYDAPTHTWRPNDTAREPQTPHNRMGHCYDHQAVRQDEGALYFATYVVDDDIGGPLFVWEAASNTWREQLIENPLVGGLGVNGDYNSFTFFPERNSFLFQNRRVLRELDADTWTWRSLETIPESIGRAHGVAEHDAPGHRVVFGGGDYPTSRQLFSYSADGELTELEPAPFDIGSERSKVVADPVSGDFLAFRTETGAPADMAVLRSGEDQWESRTIEDERVAEILRGANGHSLVISRMPVFGVIAIIGFGGDWWREDPVFLIYRHAP
jgi:hypothetical protein